MGVLAVATVFIFSLGRTGDLSISFLNVGQGDAILIESPTGMQLLVDGGVDKRVLRELGTHMSFFDRTIDVVVATHPDADHIGGLVDVFARYEVRTFIESGVASETGPATALARAAALEGVSRYTARRGMRVLLGGGSYADILYPDRDVSQRETNAGSIVLHVVHGERAFMLTGDAPKAIEGMLVSRYGDALRSDVLKAGHHGSKTSSNEYFVRAVQPQYVVYSRGCDNRYGHPADEVRTRFEQLQVSSFDTCLNGTVTFRSDGSELSASVQY